MNDRKRDAETAAPTPLSPAEVKILKEKLRNSLWTSEAVLREVTLIQKLRTLFPPRESES